MLELCWIMGFSRSRQGPFAEQLPITAISGHYLIYPDGLPANNPHSPAGIPCLRWSPPPLIFLISNTQSGYLTANWREGMCSGKGKGRGKNLSRVFISPKKTYSQIDCQNWLFRGTLSYQGKGSFIRGRHLWWWWKWPKNILMPWLFTQIIFYSEFVICQKSGQGLTWHPLPPNG